MQLFLKIDDTFYWESERRVDQSALIEMDSNDPIGQLAFVNEHHH